MSQQQQATNVDFVFKANVYFDGKVVSHTFYDRGQKKTAGLIYPGVYKFDTGAPERMDITAGTCEVTLAGENAAKTYQAGQFFEVPGNSFFEISVQSGIAEYLCSFLPS